MAYNTWTNKIDMSIYQEEFIKSGTYSISTRDYRA